MSARPASQPLDLRGPWVTSPRPWGLCSALPTLGRRQESAPLCPVLLWTTGWGAGQTQVPGALASAVCTPSPTRRDRLTSGHQRGWERETPRLPEHLGLGPAAVGMFAVLGVDVFTDCRGLTEPAGGRGAALSAADPHSRCHAPRSQVSPRVPGAAVSRRLFPDRTRPWRPG